MHLVFLNQYYPPDAAPTGVMLRAVVEECARQGHQVTVICADGGYAGGRGVVGSRLSVVSENGKEEELSPLSEMQQPGAQARQTTDNRQPTTDHSSIRIQRIPATRFGRGSFVGKLLDYASYYFGVAWRLGTMTPPPDRIVALTTPPYLSVLARAVSKLRGADHAHWVMDLYPDVMVAHGMLAEGGWKHRLLAGIARWGFGGRRCAAVLTLGPDMAARCEGVVGGKVELSVVGGPLSEKILPGPRVSRPAEPMDGESPVRQKPLASSPDTSFPFHRPCEPGDSRSGAAARQTTDNGQPATVSWVPLWGGGKEEELSVVGGPLSEKILPGPRVSRPAEPMDGESPAREEPLASSPDTSFPPHRPCEPGDSRSGALAQPTTDNGQRATVSWVPLWGGGKEEELSVVGGPLSEMILPGPRVSRPAEPMDGESPARQEPLASSPDTSFPPHRPCEPGDSRSGAAARQTTDNRQPTTPPLRKHRGWADDELIVMYSGNMGLGHRFGEVLEVVRRGEEELSVVGGQLSEIRQSGRRVSRPAEPMDGESSARQEPLASSPDTSFPPHRPCEPGDSRSGAAAQPTTPSQSGEEEELSVVSGQLSEKIRSGAEAQQTTDNGQPTTLQKSRFVFYGGGKRRGEIEAFMAAHPEAPVELHDYAAAEELTAHLMSADVHLVSLEPAWSGTMVPSKLQGIFAVGRPVVFVGSAESSIGRWVEESGGGWVVAAGDVDGLRAVLEEARDPEVRQTRGEAAARFAGECFDRETNVKRVVGILAGGSDFE